MRKIYLSICALLLVSVVKLSAQTTDSVSKKGLLSDRLKLSLDAGITYSNLRANLSNLYLATYEPKNGFGVTLSGEYALKGPFYASLGLSFLQKNFSFKRSSPLSGWYTNYENNFISVPVLVGAYLYKSNRFWAKIGAGGYFDYWLSRTAVGQGYGFSMLQLDGNFTEIKGTEKYDFKKNPYELSRALFGLQGQVQLGYHLGDIDVIGGINYLHGLTDVNKSNLDKPRKATIQSYMFSLGVAYKF